jgi:hypothetical protein
MGNSYLDSRIFYYYIKGGISRIHGKEVPAMGMKPLAIGRKVQLLPGTFPHVKIRQWTIKEFLPSGKVMLEYKEKFYTLEVGEGDIERI